MLPILALARQRNHAVEVGSLLGASTRIIARHFTNVTSVDAYAAGYDPEDLNAGAVRLAIARDAFALRFFDEPGVAQLRMRSRDACALFANETLDLVYIDAGHNYEAVRRDLECWLPKLRAGGGAT